MSQLAVFIDCQMPFKSAWPSAARGARYAVAACVRGGTRAVCDADTVGNARCAAPAAANTSTIATLGWVRIACLTIEMSARVQDVVRDAHSPAPCFACQLVPIGVCVRMRRAAQASAGDQAA